MAKERVMTKSDEDFLVGIVDYFKKEMISVGIVPDPCPDFDEYSNSCMIQLGAQRNKWRLKKDAPPEINRNKVGTNVVFALGKVEDERVCTITVLENIWEKVDSLEDMVDGVNLLTKLNLWASEHGKHNRRYTPITNLDLVKNEYILNTSMIGQRILARYKEKA